MRYIINFVKRLLVKNSVPPLGRWNINYCANIINKKIDLSNMDHCGPCGENNSNSSNMNSRKDIVIIKDTPKFIMTIKNK
jgi:hypothetical protein